ncbi:MULTISPECIES: helix-turn-helix domain-containing protein [Thiomicrorhabdus]|uniref:Putative Fis-like DNA-binding protein n=1 Tax=Thiomicrorhabdus xiamenensis TaxID=2739063 RepID=A0A7D4SMH4_9GAMM|nr:MULTISPECIES: helix-turn-helix domain-containing protein [Thiomicrorhabdus]MBO1923819.1 Fis family transcriptional regulator [Thiomicrorhabdus sp. 6S3-12]QKI88581.1 Fis family transcriptional regulator [Thiomicrorhabdus xiamenensis]
MTNIKTTSQLSLRDQVTRTLEIYFDNLQEESTCDLYEMVIQQVEKPLIEFVLQKTDFNQTQSAQMLGINRNTLRKKMLKYKLIES